jgi:hypothetical protein
MMLEDEKRVLEELRDQQRSILNRYRLMRSILLCSGTIVLISVLLWMVYHRYDLTKVSSFVPAFTLLGGGLIASTATLYPVAEILKRRDRIKYCEKLMDSIDKLRMEEKIRKINVERVQKQCREAIELLKGC